MLCNAQDELGVTIGKAESVWPSSAKVTYDFYRSEGNRITRSLKCLCVPRQGALSAWEPPSAPA